MINNENEYILCSAIHFDNKKEYVHNPVNIKTGFIICGIRHHNCFATIGQLDSNISYLKFEQTQGFLTSKNRFLDRVDSIFIAYLAGQIDKDKFNSITQLYSEDLW